MNYVLSYDYCSIVLLLTLIFFYYARPKFKNLQNEIYGGILIVGLLSCVSDVLSVTFLEKYPEMIGLNLLLLVVYNLFQNSLAPCYFVYIGVIVFSDKMAKFKKMAFVGLIPAGINSLVQILTPFTKWAFTYTVEEGYCRTNYFYPQISLTGIYMILCLVLIFAHPTKTAFVSRITVLTYTLTSFLAALFQMLYPQYLLLNAAGTFVIFAMFLSLQNPSLIKEALEDADRSKKEAEKANEAKSVFLANMSHEIRTPMNAICGMAYLLESTDLKKDAREYVNTIKSASENLLELINGILDFSKADAGKMVLQENDYNFYKIIKEIASVYATQINRERVVLNIYLDSEVPMVLRGDEYKTKQILSNLISNAVKFTDDGEINLKITARHRADNKVTITVRVKDTGIGIKETDMDKLFGYFEQVDMAKNRKKEGTGLGLPLVKSFVEIMGGDIKVESVYGSGSSFTATFEQEFVEAIPNDYKEITSKLYFLVLESNPYVRKSIERTLKNLNIEYTIDDNLSRDVLIQRGGINCCILYNYYQYQDQVESCDLKGLFNIKKIAMVDFDFIEPEDTKGIIYVKNPFYLQSVLSFGDDKRFTATPEPEKQKEAILFSDKTKIALVDDNRVNLKVTNAILKKFGIQSTMYLSGFEIIDALEKNEQFDLIFMDHMMPEMDGVETVKKIRLLKNGNCAEVPILALTANAVEGAREEFLAAGMNDALFKPVDVKALKEALKTWLPENLRIS